MLVLPLGIELSASEAEAITMSYQKTLELKIILLFNSS